MLKMLLLVLCPIGGVPPNGREIQFTTTVKGALVTVLASAAIAFAEASQDASAPVSALTAIERAQAIDDEAVDGEHDPADLSSVTDEVAAILDQCDAASREIQTVKAEIKRTTYNLIFEVERLADGEMCFQSPDKLSLDLKPAEIPQGMKGLKLGKAGQPFRLESDHAESWLWLPDQVAMANPEARTVERIQRSELPQLRVVWFWPVTFRLMHHSRPPFLVGIDSQQVRREWNLTIAGHRDQAVILRALPRTVAGKAQCKQCLVLINTSTWHVDAVKIFDPSDSIDTVYQITNRTINQPLPPGTFDPATKWQGFKELTWPKID